MGISLRKFESCLRLHFMKTVSPAIQAAFDRGAQDRSNNKYENPFSRFTEPMQWYSYEFGYQNEIAKLAKVEKNKFDV